VVHDRVATAILQCATKMLARGGATPSMTEVAEAAGVARATVYRYYPTREQLLQALASTALDAITGRLADAELATAGVAEGLGRVARAIVAVGTEYAALASHPERIKAADVQTGIETPIRDLMQRGLDDGIFSTSLTVTELTELFCGLLQGAVRLSAQRDAGVERASALVTSVFLRGTTSPAS
jgi:TetR/AcrR family transcriptional regulator, mexCD-oprJ operon repressor